MVKLQGLEKEEFEYYNPRCSECGCFMKATCWTGENSEECESLVCNNVQCKGQSWNT